MCSVIIIFRDVTVVLVLLEHLNFLMVSGHPLQCCKFECFLPDTPERIFWACDCDGDFKIFLLQCISVSCPVMLYPICVRSEIRSPGLLTAWQADRSV